jgi:subtilisin family serine protease
MVAGIAAAKDNNIGVVGTAPGARIWALKVFPDSRNGDESDVLEALNYVAQHGNEIEVVNLSLGQPGFSWPYLIAISTLIAGGVVVVAAAGNDNLDANYDTPASVPWAITVSAMTDTDGKCGGVGPAISYQRTHLFQPRSIRNPDDFFASYSNYGSVIDLLHLVLRYCQQTIKQATVPDTALALQLPTYQAPLHYTKLFIQQLIHSR